MDRIVWACKAKGAKVLIQHTTCTIQLIVESLRFEHASGDPIVSAKLIRDLEILALDKDYYPVGDEIEILPD